MSRPLLRMLAGASRRMSSAWRLNQAPPTRLRGRCIAIFALWWVGQALAATTVRIDKRAGLTGDLPDNIKRIAVCPAVLFKEDAAVSEATGVLVYNQLLQRGVRAMPPDLTVSAMGRTLEERARLHAAVDVAVRKGGAIDSALALSISRAARVDALLFLRIDRWEVVGSDRPMMCIELFANLTDSTGQSIWRCSGRANTMDEAGVRGAELDIGGQGRVGETSITKALVTAPGVGAVDVPANTRIESRSGASVPEGLAGAEVKSGARIPEVDPRFRTALDSLCVRIAGNFPRVTR